MYLLRTNFIYTRHNFFENVSDMYLFFKFFIVLMLLSLLYYGDKSFRMLNFTVVFYMMYMLICLILFNYINYSSVKLFMYKIFIATLLYLLNINVWVGRFKIIYHIYIYTYLLVYALIHLQYLFTFNKTLMQYIFDWGYNNRFLKNFITYDSNGLHIYQTNLKLTINKHFSYSTLTNIYGYYLKKKIINYI